MKKRDQMHPEDKKNLLWFLVYMLALYASYDLFVVRPRMEAVQAQRLIQQDFAAARATGTESETFAERPRAQIIAEGGRIEIAANGVFGTLPLRGGRIDDVSLARHFETLEREDHIKVMSPAGSLYPRYAEFGWIAAEGETVRLPDSSTLWQIRGTAGARGTIELTPDQPVTFFWDNGQGLVFEREVAVDRNYLFTVTQHVINQSSRTVRVHPYAKISQRGMPETFEGRFIAHEGPIGYIDTELEEISYKSFLKTPRIETAATKGWIGITEKYWLVALLPDQTHEKHFRFLSQGHQSENSKALYQTDFMNAALTIAPSERGSSTTHLFAGAKEIKLLESYEKELGLTHLDLAVDFGIYYFLTKPFFHILYFLYEKVGNFGVAIIILTILLRTAVFPLANKSYRSFAKLKVIAPEMTALKTKYGTDKERFQKELIALYEREKVNPMAGCLPILVQIPIFFALYKVLYISIEMRHAPFFGWIEDLSARDPTSVFNLFGLIPWTPPEILMIGVWPCLMLVAMLLQRSMTPPPQDKIQAQIFATLPWVFALIMAKFPAGLVVYWTFSNFFSVLQQYIIMRSMGVEVKFFPKAEAPLLLSPPKETDTGRDSSEETPPPPDKPTEITPPKPRRKKKK